MAVTAGWAAGNLFAGGTAVVTAVAVACGVGTSVKFVAAAHAEAGSDGGESCVAVARDDSGSGAFSVVAMCLAACVFLWVEVLDDGMWDGRVRFYRGFLWVGFAVCGRFRAVEFVVFDGRMVVCFCKGGDA